MVVKCWTVPQQRERTGLSLILITGGLLMADNKFMHDNGCKEAVCVDAGRVYDSCSEEQCARYIQIFSR